MENYKDSPKQNVKQNKTLKTDHDLRKYELKAEDERCEMKPLLRTFKSWPTLENSKQNHLTTVSRTFDSCPKHHPTKLEQHFKGQSFLVLHFNDRFYKNPTKMVKSVGTDQ